MFNIYREGEWRALSFRNCVNITHTVVRGLQMLLEHLFNAIMTEYKRKSSQMAQQPYTSWKTNLNDLVISFAFQFFIHLCLYASILFILLIISCLDFPLFRCLFIWSSSHFSFFFLSKLSENSASFNENYFITNKWPINLLQNVFGRDGELLCHYL